MGHMLSCTLAAGNEKQELRGAEARGKRVLGFEEGRKPSFGFRCKKPWENNMVQRQAIHGRNHQVDVVTTDALTVSKLKACLTCSCRETLWHCNYAVLVTGM